MRPGSSPSTLHKSSVVLLCQQDALPRAPSSAGGKSGVVFNPGCRASLPSGAQPIEHERGQALRRCVNGRSETRRSGTQYQNVISRAWQPLPQMKMVGQLLSCGSLEKHVVSVCHHRIRLN